MARTSDEKYLKLIWDKTISRPFAVSGIVSFLLLLLQAINFRFKWVTDDTMTTWGIIIPVIVFVISVILFIFLAPYEIYKEHKKEIKQLRQDIKDLNSSTISESELKLRGMRLRVRNSKVSEIPDILINLHKEVKNIAIQRKDDQVSIDTLSIVVQECLGINEADIKKYGGFNIQVMKFTQKKMGLTKWDKDKAKNWQLTIGMILDAHHIGVSDYLTPNYNEEISKLEGIVTSNKKLDDAIDMYIRTLISMYNTKLYIHYTSVQKDKDVQKTFSNPVFTAYVKDTERRIVKEIKDKQMDVLKELEKYSTGEAIDDEYSLNSTNL